MTKLVAEAGKAVTANSTMIAEKLKSANINARLSAVSYGAASPDAQRSVNAGHGQVADEQIRVLDSEERGERDANRIGIDLFWHAKFNR